MEHRESKRLFFLNHMLASTQAASFFSTMKLLKKNKLCVAPNFLIFIIQEDFAMKIGVLVKSVKVSRHFEWLKIGLPPQNNFNFFCLHPISMDIEVSLR